MKTNECNYDGSDTLSNPNLAPNQVVTDEELFRDVDQFLEKAKCISRDYYPWGGKFSDKS